MTIPADILKAARAYSDNPEKQKGYIRGAMAVYLRVRK